MTPEQINGAIAEIHGWENICYSGARDRWDGNPPRLNKRLEIPNYHGSLDAIVPVIRELDYFEKDAVFNELWLLSPNFKEAILATPAQWCEAYLRAKSLWKVTNE